MFLSPLRALLIPALLLSVWTGAVCAAEMLPGPYQGRVERAVDGDTLAVRVTVWLHQELYVLVRVRGIDAPELRGRCESEKLCARDAADALARLVAGGPVVLTRIEGDKYFGRVLAALAPLPPLCIVVNGRSRRRETFARVLDRAWLCGAFPFRLPPGIARRRPPRRLQRLPC